MKKLIYLLCVTFLMLQSCSSDSSKNSENINNTLLLGKWNLVSDFDGTANNPIETITTCQKEFWQFDFKNSNELIFRTTSDDPSLTLNQCSPILINYTYSINNETVTMTPVKPDYKGGSLKIKSISSTQLVLTNDNGDTFRMLTFKK